MPDEPDKPPRILLNDGQRRRLSATLTLLDRALIEFDLWAAGRERRSALCHERNDLSEDQRRRIRQLTDQLRERLQALKASLGLPESERDAATDIRARCAVLWEALWELTPERLDRYGSVSDEAARLLNSELPQLIRCVEAVSETASVRSRSTRRGPAA